MALLSLPNELLLKIARCLLRCPNCDCHHSLTELSAFSRSNRRLHVLLAKSRLGPSATGQMLLWGIVNSRNDIVALALEHGADSNAPLRRSINNHGSNGPAASPMELAIRMRDRSDDAESHALKLATLALLFGAGGTCVTGYALSPAWNGDLDLLALCLPHLDLTDYLGRHGGRRTLLSTTACRGHVEAAKLILTAGAAVNSTGDQNSDFFYPALWSCWHGTIDVVQLLLDEGADAAWRAPSGVSVVQNMRQRARTHEGVEEKIALLVRYGAVDEPSAGLPLEPENRSRFAPVSQGGFGPRRQRSMIPLPSEYRGWVACTGKAAVDWPMELVLAQRQGACACLSCKL